ncbi:MAG TPA: dTDP-4-dehydrorhamnose 3,5-epimerase [Ignavibacteria bacterium]|nr:dTDP-4-dehydrorhamnose 3,5-epimerase [Ignavibacteria bacterium]
MKTEKTKINGVLIITPDLFPDGRGFFFESYNKDRYEAAGIPDKFVQDNFSRSTYGTIRGLHFQIGNAAQGKLCQVISGRVLDVAVDIRKGSPTYGQHVSVELTDENHKQIWMPPGFAHGFSVLSETAIFSYKCTAMYSKSDERAILYNDSDLNINWRVEKPVVSEKDLKSGSFKNLENYFNY